MLRPWYVLLGSIPGKKPGAPASAGKEQWSLFRTASMSSWFLPALALTRLLRLPPLV